MARIGRWSALARLLGTAGLWLAVTGPGQAAPALEIVARPGPWPVVSELVAYRDRVWLVNSVKGRNHNAADVYSYGPADRGLRFERGLFSQDAGTPVAAHGLLYWPMEDFRFSLGWGAFAVTDGSAWSVGDIPGGMVFHTHAMASDGRRLVAAISGWRAGLAESLDRGATWRQIHEHPTADGVVSRVTDLAMTGGRIFAQLVEAGTPRLTSYRDGRLAGVPGWPEGFGLRGHAIAGGRFHGILAGRHEGSDLWSSDGIGSRPEPRDTIGGSLVDLAAEGGRLWAVSSTGDGGAVWRRSNDGPWEEVTQLTGGQPHSLLVMDGRPYVGGEGTDGRGVLWGPAGAVAPSALPAPPPMPVQPSRHAGPIDWHLAGRSLDAALADPAGYRRETGNLRDLVRDLAVAHSPAGFFSARLAGPLPRDPMALIGGRVTITAADYARWVLLWGMGRAREAAVPLSLLTPAWTAPANSSEKYFAALPAALWAIREARQDDPATLAALVARLDAPGDPDWLTAQVAGTLATLTGRPYTASSADWRRWLAEPARPENHAPR